MNTQAQQALSEFWANPAAKADGLSIDLSIRGNALLLEHIGVEPENWGIDIGKDALRALLHYADKHGVALHRECAQSDAEIDLLSWHSRCEFVWRHTAP